MLTVIELRKTSTADVRTMTRKVFEVVARGLVPVLRSEGLHSALYVTRAKITNIFISVSRYIRQHSEVLYRGNSNIPEDIW